MLNKRKPSHVGNSIPTININKDPITPIIEQPNVSMGSSDYLANINNGPAHVEFFNSHYDKDWFSSKYCPVRRRDFVLSKFASSKILFTKTGSSDYIDLYFSKLMLQNRLPHNVLGSFICFPSITLDKTRDELESYVKGVDIAGFQELILSEPLPKIRMRRLGWYVFDSNENAKLAIKKLESVESEELYKPYYLPAKESNRKIKTVDPAFESELRKRFDLLVSAKILYSSAVEVAGVPQTDVSNLISLFFSKIRSEMDSIPSTPLSTDSPEETVKKAVKPKKGPKKKISKKENEISLTDTLTFFTDTLRDYYNFCYYCGRFFISKDEMIARCGRVHLRSDYTNRWSSLISEINTNTTKYVSSNYITKSSTTQLPTETESELNKEENKEENHFINTPETFKYEKPEDGLYLSNEEIALLLDPTRLMELNFTELAILAKTYEKKEEGELDTETVSAEEIIETQLNSQQERILNIKLRSQFEAVNEKSLPEPNWKNLEIVLKKEAKESPQPVINSKVLVAKLLFNRKRFGLIRFYKEFKDSWAVDNLKNCVVMEYGGAVTCSLCNKKFGSSNFIEKHMTVKHRDMMEDLLRELYFKEYFMNYYRDDMKIGFDTFNSSKDKVERFQRQKVGRGNKKRRQN